MDHRRIDDQNVAELYVTGRLSPEDEETFESHLLECAECRERVGWADDLRTSIRTLVAEEAARATVQAGFLAWLSRRTRAARGGILMALLAVAALPAWLQADRARLSRELDEARAEATAAKTVAERPAAPAPAPVPASPAQPANTPDPEKEKLVRVEAELAETRAQLARRADTNAPQVNARYISLGVVRGESETALDLGPEPILVSLELPQVNYDVYRVTLVEGKNRIQWSGDGVEPMGNDGLNVLLPPGTLKPGTSYRFRIEGLEPGGRAVPVGEIPFRAVKS